MITANVPMKIVRIILEDGTEIEPVRQTPTNIRGFTHEGIALVELGIDVMDVHKFWKKEEKP